MSTNNFVAANSFEAPAEDEALEVAGLEIRRILRHFRTTITTTTWTKAAQGNFLKSWK